MKTVFFCVLVVLFLSCEDKKKAPNKTIEPVATKKDTLNKATQKKKETVTDTFPYITNKNVVEFLTAYGKENPETKVALKTRKGTIEVELYKDTPLHRANFIYLVKNGYLNTTVFHRVIPGFMIQGGNSDNWDTSKMRNKIGKYTIPAEIKHKNVRGALAAAKEYRKNPDDRSSSFEFYIVQGHNGAHHLDPNYTVFGKVTKGMAVVDTIAQLRTDDGDWPLHNIYMEATVEE